MHLKQDYTKFKNQLNDEFLIKIYKKYHFLFIVENKKAPWYDTAFATLQHKSLKMNNIPNIEICLNGFHWEYCELIAMLAHETGHFLSFFNKEAPPNKINDYIRNKIHCGKSISKAERTVILDEEKRAWKYGFQILEEYDIDICEDMRKFRKLCLNNYYYTTKRR